MESTLRMPISSASRKGISAIAAEAEHHRVLLTSHGRPVAVVDSAERLDEVLRSIREAARSVVEVAGDRALVQTKGFSLSEVCDRLGLDVNAVHKRAGELRAR